MVAKRVGAGLLSLVLVGLPILVAVHLSRIRPSLRASAQIQPVLLSFRIPPNTLELLEIGPGSSFGLRIVGMTVVGKGMEGTIGIQDKKVSIDRTTEFALHPQDNAPTSYVDVRTTDPLTLAVESQEGLEIEVAPGIMFGSDIHVQQATVSTADYVIRGRRPVKGNLHAKSLNIWRVHGMNLANEAISTVSLSSPAAEERSGPLTFESPTISLGRIRIAVDDSKMVAEQGVRTPAGQITAERTEGRLVVGTRSIGFSGLEEVKIVGDLTIRSLGTRAGRINTLVTGTASELLIGGESVLPSVLENVALRPSWTIIFGIILLTLTALITPVIKFALTGTWGGE